MGRLDSLNKRRFDSAQSAWENLAPDDDEWPCGVDGEPLTPEQVEELNKRDYEDILADQFEHTRKYW